MTRKYHKDGTLPTNPNSVWVFGSNTLGHHAAGAARVAVDKFGAVYGQAHGRQDMAFAIATVNDNGGPLNTLLVNRYVAEFLVHAEAEHYFGSADEFFITRIGCGIAGFTDAQIAPMFKHAPLNCNLPEEWRRYIDGC